MHTSHVLPGFRFGAFCAAGALLLSLGASVSDASPGRLRQASAKSFARNFAVEPLASDAVRAQDRAFVEKALELSRQQARLAELGVSQATSAEVRSHAQQLTSDQRELTDALTAFARKKGMSLRAPADVPSEAAQKLATTPGGEFDRAFIRVLADLHDETITAFEQATSEAKDADLRELAASELPRLREHRNRITDLRKRFD